MPPSPLSRLRDYGGVIGAIDPYLLDPIALTAALWRGCHTRRIGDVTATFETTDIWETASLLHTFRKEAVVFDDLLASLRSDDVFYDIGANLGVFTCLAGAVISEGDAIAFEPHPDNVARIERNVELNGVDALVYECALSNESETADLSVDVGRAGNQRHALATGEDGRTIDVETVDGDRLVERGEIPPPTVVKIDVEGAERRVIDGLKSSLSREGCRTVYCEIHPELLEGYGDTPGAVRRALDEAGFELEPLHSSGGQSYLKGKKR